jgi:hypothetical protein
LAGAARTSLANPLPFIASGAAVGFWYFFPKEKGLGPRGHQRDEIISGWWATPTKGKWLVKTPTTGKTQIFPYFYFKH